MPRFYDHLPGFSHLEPLPTPALAQNTLHSSAAAAPPLGPHHLETPPSIPPSAAPVVPVIQSPSKYVPTLPCVAPAATLAKPSDRNARDHVLSVAADFPLTSFYLTLSFAGGSESVAGGAFISLSPALSLSDSHIDSKYRPYVSLTSFFASSQPLFLLSSFENSRNGATGDVSDNIQIDNPAASRFESARLVGDFSHGMSSLRGGIECLAIKSGCTAVRLLSIRSRPDDDAPLDGKSSLLAPHVTRRRQPKPIVNGETNPAGPFLIGVSSTGKPSSMPFASRVSFRRTERSSASRWTSKTYQSIKGVHNCSRTV